MSNDNTACYCPLTTLAGWPRCLAADLCMASEIKSALRPPTPPASSSDYLTHHLGLANPPSADTPNVSRVRVAFPARRVCARVCAWGGGSDEARAVGWWPPPCLTVSDIIVVSVPRRRAQGVEAYHVHTTHASTQVSKHVR